MNPSLLITAFLSRLGFLNINYPIIFGDPRRLHAHPTASQSNTLFNTISGEIYIGDHSFFGHNCMVLTGVHKRGGDMQTDIPTSGYDIHIGNRCWIASGSIILGNVTIGDDTIIAAASIITKDVPERSVVKGVW